METIQKQSRSHNHLELMSDDEQYVKQALEGKRHYQFMQLCVCILRVSVSKESFVISILSVFNNVIYSCTPNHLSFQYIEFFVIITSKCIYY